MLPLLSHVLRIVNIIKQQHQLNRGRRGNKEVGVQLRPLEGSPEMRILWEEFRAGEVQVPRMVSRHSDAKPNYTACSMEPDLLNVSMTYDLNVN